MNDNETPADVGASIRRAVEYIEKQYPDAEKLDAGPILRNMRRWADRIERALSAQQPTHWANPETGEAISDERKRALIADYGIGGAKQAARFSRPLYATPQPEPRLYNAINRLMMRIGHDGDINSKAQECADVMAALAEIDGGTYRPQPEPKPASVEVTDGVLPLESATAAGLTCDDLLSDWVPGGIKPAEHGTYLRQFPAGEFDEDPEETEALSSWDGIGQWKMGDASDFFSNTSPEQSAPWRGVCPRKLIAALTAALQPEKRHD